MIRDKVLELSTLSKIGVNGTYTVHSSIYVVDILAVPRFFFLL
jgi:hypothetical protein